MKKWNVKKWKVRVSLRNEDGETTTVMSDAMESDEVATVDDGIAAIRQLLAQCEAPEPILQGIESELVGLKSKDGTYSETEVGTGFTVVCSVSPIDPTIDQLTSVEYISRPDKPVKKMKRTTKNKCVVNARVDPQLRAVLKDYADNTGQTVSHTVEQAIRAFLISKGAQL